MKQEFNIVYEKDDDWWVATALEIPGAHSQGKTIDEAREMLFDAIKELMLAQRQLAEAEFAGRTDVVRERRLLELT